MEIIHKCMVYDEGRLPGVMSLRWLAGKIVAMASVREYRVFYVVSAMLKHVSGGAGKWADVIRVPIASIFSTEGSKGISYD